MKMKKLWLPIIAGLGLTVALVGLLGTNQVVAAPTATITVDTAVDGADGECTDDCTLREAIILANTNGNGQGDTIELGTAIYNLSLTGGSGPAVGDLDVTARNALTITGHGPQNTVINANGIDRVLSVYSTAGSRVVISGVTIYGGVTTGPAGGIFNGSADLLLVNVAVVSNTAASGGGGIQASGASASITMDENCRIVRNAADFGGGLSLISGAQALLGGGQIVSNTASTNGGGLHVEQSSVTLDGVEVISNTASTSGGGAYVNSGAAMLSGGAIVSNTAGVDGGGVYVIGAFTQTGQSAIGYNGANQRGGGVYVQYGRVALNGGQIAHNRVVGLGDDEYGGGGVYVSTNGVLLQAGSSTILDNTVAMHGGGVYATYGRVTLSGGEVVSNTAGKRGGGAYLHVSAAFTQTGGLIADNVAQGMGTGEGGGGICSRYQNQIALNGGQVRDNQAENGGGLSVGLGTFDLLGGEIVANQAISGGGVYVGAAGQSTLIEGGGIVSNTADYGAGLHAGAGNVTLKRGQVVGNRAKYDGGGVYHGTGVSADVLTLVNTTVSGNTADDDGGGLYNANGIVVLTHTTVASNTAGSSGFGIAKKVGSILAKNTIVAYNSPSNCGSGALTSQNHNIDDGATCGLGGGDDQTGVDPELASLAEDRDTLIHAIAQDSPACDAGMCQAGITIDQRGVPRLAPCDVGAYEYTLQIFLPLVLRSYP